MSTLVEAEAVGAALDQLIDELEVQTADGGGGTGTRIDGAVAALERLRNDGLAIIPTPEA